MGPALALLALVVATTPGHTFSTWQLVDVSDSTIALRERFTVGGLGGAEAAVDCGYVSRSIGPDGVVLEGEALHLVPRSAIGADGRFAPERVTSLEVQTAARSPSDCLPSPEIARRRTQAAALGREAGVTYDSRSAVSDDLRCTTNETEDGSWITRTFVCSGDSGALGARVSWSFTATEKPATRECGAAPGCRKLFEGALTLRSGNAKAVLAVSIPGTYSFGSRVEPRTISLARIRGRGIALLQLRHGFADEPRLFGFAL